MGSRLSFAVSNVFICGLVVSVCFSEKSLFTIIKIVKNKLIEYKKLFCRLKTFHESYEDVRHGKRKPRPHTFT